MMLEVMVIFVMIMVVLVKKVALVMIIYGMMIMVGIFTTMLMGMRLWWRCG